MSHNLSGFFAMTDGLDGVGKGTVEIAILDSLKEKGFRVFDQVAYEIENRAKPDFLDRESKWYVDLNDFDVIYMGEPGEAGTGFDLRYEVIKKSNKGKYDARETLSFYSNDRLINIRRNLIPALEAGKIIIKSRGLPASCCYQQLQAENEGNPLSYDEILSYSGNSLTLEYPPDILIIPTIKNPDDLIARLDKRDKQDDCQFETIEFQIGLKPRFESKELRELFEKAGSKVTYIDAGISIEESKRQAIDSFNSVFEPYLTKRNSQK